MEFLDLVDEQGNPTGEIVLREKAHLEGLRHRTSHVWLLRQRGNNWDVLLQKRSAAKDSFPGCYDISSAGHIPTGVDWIPSALRELAEELGIIASERELHLAGIRSVYWEGEFRNQPFRDREVSQVFYMIWNGDETKLHLQESEVESVRWMELERCIYEVKSGELEGCIYPEELEMVRFAVKNQKNA